MIDEIKINDIDVTTYRISWYHEGEDNIAIDQLEIYFGKAILDVIDPVVGATITVKRGFSSVSEDFVFEGIIIQRNPTASKIKVVAKSMLIEAIKSRRIYSWDYDLDPEAGVGSEIFKAHCDNATLYYDSDSIISTGSGSGDIIKKWVQNDEDDYQKMKELADNYNYSITYRPRNTGTGRVFFVPKGYDEYPIDLNVGIQIPGQIEWIEDMDQLINKVKINGATVYDKIVETGTGLSFTLSKTPEDTEVRETDETGTLLTRGQKDLGVLGSDFDYYIDVEQKKVVVTGTGVYWIRYGAQVPMPVILSNVTSIEQYGGPNKTPSYKKFFYNDIKDISDAEKRGRSILAKYSIPFNEAEDIPISNTTLQSQYIKPGDLLHIIDNYNDIDLNVVAKIVKKRFPHVYDTVTVGDKLWRTADFDASVQEKLLKLFNELNKNQEILTSVSDLTETHYFRARYFETQKKDRSSSGTEVFILGHSTFGVLGTQKLGEDATSFVRVNLTQGNNIYREFFYDTDFEGSTTGGGSAVWDTTNKRLEIGPSTTYTTAQLALNTTFKWFTYVLASSTGTGASIACQVSADGGSNYTTLTSNTKTEVTNRSGSGVYFRIVNSGTGTGFISNSYTDEGEYVSPAIYLKMEEP